MSDTLERTNNYPKILSFVVGAFLFFLGAMIAYDLIVGEPIKTIILILFTKVTFYIALYIYIGTALMAIPIIIWMFERPQRALWISVASLYIFGFAVEGAGIKAAYFITAVASTIYGVTCYG